METFLELDVWSRYQEWAQGDGKVGKKAESKASTVDYDEKDVGKMREATVQARLPYFLYLSPGTMRVDGEGAGVCGESVRTTPACSTSTHRLHKPSLPCHCPPRHRPHLATLHWQLLTIREELDVFKQVAKALEAAENIDFYLDIKEYQERQPYFSPQFLVCMSQFSHNFWLLASGSWLLASHCLTSHFPRLTSHVSRLTSHISRLTSHVSLHAPLLHGRGRRRWSRNGR